MHATARSGWYAIGPWREASVAGELRRLGTGPLDVRRRGLGVTSGRWLAGYASRTQAWEQS